MSAFSDSSLSVCFLVFQLLTIFSIVLSFAGAIGLWVTTDEIDTRKDRKVYNLEEQLRPRVITSAQCEKFVELLQHDPKGKILVFVYNQDSEILNYANQIRDMVIAAGYDSEKNVAMSFGSQSPVGIIMIMKDRNAQPPFTGSVQKAFQGIGIKPQGAIDSETPDGAIIIVVGRKISK